MSIKAGNVVQLSLVALFMGAFGAIIGTGLTTLVSAHGGDEDLVHACVRDVPAPTSPLGSLFSVLLRDGDVRIVDADEECKPGEVAVDWPGIGGGGLTGYEIVSVAINATAANITTEKPCPSGKEIIGGGVQASTGFAVGSSFPVVGSNSWQGSMVTLGANAPGTITVYAICADVTP